MSLTQHTPSGDAPSPAEVHEQIGSLSRSDKFTPTELRLLEYLTQASLGESPVEITGKLIAADVFGRDLQQYDPRKDSLVKVNVSNLRKKLSAYYSAEGTSDPVVFQLPPSGYQLSASRRLPLSPRGMRQFWNAHAAMEKRTPAAFRQGLQLLDRILAEAPQVPEVVTLKAEVLMTRSMYGFLPYPDLLEARRLIDTVLAKPAADWRAYLVDGGLRAVLRGDWTGAFESFHRSLALREHECRIHPWYTACLLAQGKPQEAILLMRKAVHDHGYHVATVRGDLSILEILGREYEAALDTTEATIELFPDYFLPHLHRALALDAMGSPHAALEALHKTPLRLHERPVTWGFYAYFAGRRGEIAKAEHRLRWLKALRRVQYVPSLQLAIASLGAHRYDEAVEWLETGWHVERDPLLIWVYAYPFCAELQGTPRFERLVDAIGLVRF